jgi:hypothetical protein
MSVAESLEGAAVDRAEEALAVERVDAAAEYLEPLHYGPQKLEWVAADEIVAMSQVRDGVNPVFGELKGSVAKRQKILEPVIAAWVTEELLGDYIEFVNEVWKAEHKLADYRPSRFGKYLLLIAGNTRFAVIKSVESDREQEALARGQTDYNPGKAQILTSIEQVDSPAEILALQLEENIHSRPNSERSAMGLVETYKYGLRHGIWNNKRQFLAQNQDKFSEYDLNNALAFADLPDFIRGIILDGACPYLAGVELGRTLPVYREYLLKKSYKDRSFDDLTSEEVDEFESTVDSWLLLQTATLERGKFSSKAAQNLYRNMRRDMSGKDDDGKEVGVQSVFDIFEQTAINELQSYRRRLLDDYYRKMADIAKDPVDKSKRVIYAHDLAVQANRRLDEGEFRERLQQVGSALVAFATDLAQPKRELAVASSFGL